MGLFSEDKPPIYLPTISPPLGINLDFVHHPRVTLVVKEEGGFSGDDFTVTDIDGAPVVTCSAKFFSMSGRRAILDPQGKKLFEMTEIFFSWRMTFVGKDDEGNVLFQLKRRSSFSSSKMEVEFTNIATGQPVRLLVKGDWRARNAIIEIENGEPVAQIKRTVWDVRNILQDKQTYFVDVAPGVDLALIAAVCIGLDEMENDGRRR